MIDLLIQGRVSCFLTGSVLGFASGVLMVVAFVRWPVQEVPPTGQPTVSAEVLAAMEYLEHQKPKGKQ